MILFFSMMRCDASDTSDPIWASFCCLSQLSGSIQRYHDQLTKLAPGRILSFTLALVLLVLVSQTAMAFNNPAAICSTAAYKPYLQLSGFPAAQDYCSNLFSERPAQVGGPKCFNKSDLCTLLSYLQDADLDFAQTVW